MPGHRIRKGGRVRTRKSLNPVLVLTHVTVNLPMRW